MKFQLFCQYYTKNLGSVNCQANGFPFLFCHNHCLLGMITHSEKCILDFDTLVSAGFNSRFSQVPLQCRGHSGDSDNSEISLLLHHKEREKNIKSFQPFLSRWTDFKMSINGSRVKSLYRQDDTTLTSRKWRGTKELLDGGERGEWQSWLKTRHSKN